MPISSLIRLFSRPDTRHRTSIHTKDNSGPNKRFDIKNIDIVVMPISSLIRLFSRPDTRHRTPSTQNNSGPTKDSILKKYRIVLCPSPPDTFVSRPDTRHRTPSTQKTTPAPTKDSYKII
ncbi:hypothetical protein TNCT_9831 [Trichonephila clavata]|uniref:Uncharacterized protein n=1 Tax=Trichonephila clavata TaxID=2740835 RepID=A0A8X6I6V3_TRICU|nr:hypothetical protein TNCT_9831 [Trichonephila clavata]